MKSILIRDLSPETLERLKRLARSHNRSLQGELRALLERTARLVPEEAGEEELDLVVVNSGRTSTWGRDEIYGTQGR